MEAPVALAFALIVWKLADMMCKSTDAAIEEREREERKTKMLEYFERENARREKP